MKHDHIINIHEYHRAKEKREAVEARIMSAIMIICLFIICPMLAHYL